MKRDNSLLAYKPAFGYKDKDEFFFILLILITQFCI